MRNEERLWVWGCAAFIALLLGWLVINPDYADIIRIGLGFRINW